MKKSIVFLLILCLVYLTGCQFPGINFKNIRESISIAEDFCLALSEDIELAKEYLHPDSSPSKDQLQAFIEEIEQQQNVRFSDGVALKDRDGVVMEADIYDPSICRYSFVCEIVVGTKAIKLSFTLRKDDSGYSIIHIKQGSDYKGEE